LPGSQPYVFTIILNWNGLADTRECLQSLQRIDYASNHTVVVDNGSADDPTAEVQRAHPGARIIRNSTNIGFASAVIWSFFVPAILYVNLLLSESLAVFLLVLSLLFFLRARRQASIPNLFCASSRSTCTC